MVTTENSRGDSPPDLGALLASVVSKPLPEVLQAVVAQAARLVEPGLSCGVTVQVSEREPVLVSSSDVVAERLDQAQYRHQDGPCMHAMRSGEVVVIDDVATETRWPWLAEQAHLSGLQATLSVPLSAGGAHIGALNLYRRADTTFTTGDRRALLAFAQQSAPVVAVAVRLAHHDTTHPAHPVEEHTRPPYENRAALPGGPDEIEQLRDLALHDDLTGLANRRGISSLLEEFLNNGVRERVGVLFCDLDNFKRINDALGHEAGDEVLVSLARTLYDGLPIGCTPARISGDEFVIICSDVQALGGLEALTQRASELLSGPVPLHQTLVEITASVGAAMVTGPGITSADLMRFADAAMFEAKDRGAGSVSVSDPALITTVNRQLVLENDLREALEHDELELHYQPIVNRAGRIFMAEALLRWSHPDYGMLSPELILDAAQRGNLLSRLDAHVLRAASREAAEWSRLHAEPPAIAVNLGTLPDDPQLAEHITSAIDESGLSWNRLVLEITETPLAGLTDTTRQEMVRLAGRGLRFAIDDFGTGYSSLARLDQLPVQIIKLDQSFTAHLADTTAHTISAAVVSIANGIGHTCIAEGVETPAQLRTLDRLGYHAYQGFLISPALPDHEFRTLLHTPLAMPTTTP